jgi:hypothetical protein
MTCICPTCGQLRKPKQNLRIQLPVEIPEPILCDDGSYISHTIKLDGTIKQVKASFMIPVKDAIADYRRRLKLYQRHGTKETNKKLLVMK